MKRLHFVRAGWLLAFALCAAPASAQRAEWGLGGRLGDPVGLSVKHYSPRLHWEVNFGRSFHLRGGRYYRGQFVGIYQEQIRAYPHFEYVSHRTTFPLSIQGHVLRQRPLSGINGLQWYAGGGAQVRFVTCYYDYRYRRQGYNDWRYVRNARQTNVDVGLDGVVGLEYFVPQLPFSLFADATVFVELADQPGHVYLQGGLGGRFVF